VDPVALLLVLLAAFFSAAWNRVLHGAGDRVAIMGVSGVMTGLLLLPATLIAPPWAVLGLILLSALAETAYSLALSAAYARGELSLTYPLGRGTAPLLVALLGWAALGERPEAATLAGAAILGGGIVLLSHAGWRAGRPDAVGFALLAGLAIASYTVIDARAVRQVSPAAYLGPVLGLQGALICAGMRWSRERLVRSLRPSLLVAISSVVAYGLILFSFRRAEAGRVATLREVAVLIGILLSGERPGVWIWTGAVLCVVGAVLAAW
jgi:drug/metabolite transporter (DMT)-like permease